jgi:hypothetical protein
MFLTIASDQQASKMSEKSDGSCLLHHHLMNRKDIIFAKTNMSQKNDNSRLSLVLLLLLSHYYSK